MSEQLTTGSHRAWAEAPAGPALPPATLVGLLMTLQSSLDLETVLKLFHEEARRLVPFTRLTYRTADGKVVIDSGGRGRFQVVYRLALAEGEPLGDLRFARARPFEEDELQALESAVGLLQAPLCNALRYREAVAMARCDGLTGLFNRAAFDESLTREVRLAKRHRDPLSILMLDVNDFKAINDRYGHRTGDAVLRWVAGAVRRCARQSDLIFRYAGDEFVVLASHTDAAGAANVARRITRAFGGEAQAIGPSGERIRVDASVGMATLRERESPEHFFDRADQNMYTMKARRDTVAH